ncbi:MAG TPA: pentapeptide repeat-containing protein [Candidatus Sulfotelmatobacter sp.]|nr:pentapeptide repeat-containing protein [Candidatus Sulfotelmatobacter sp.]
MLEAIVGVALYAVVASVVLGAILAACVFVATRTLALTAATRHLLWTIALVATGAMPVLGIATSLLHSTHVAHTAPAGSWSVPPPTRDERAAADRTRGAAHGAPAAHTRAVAPAPGIASTPVERLHDVRVAIADSVPMLSRDVALGVVAVWLIGAAIGLGGLLFSVQRVRGLKRRSSPLDSPLAEELPWLTEIGPGREIYLRLSYETETPVAIGFRRPVILIPTELATADGLAAIEQLILHEHAHLRRYDDWTNLVQRTIERIFWFNPIVWLVGRRIALEREIASDDAVVDRTGAAHQYATSLWKLAREMRMPEHAVVAPGALLTRKQISVRIEQLLDKNRARLHRSPATALGMAIAGCAAVALVATAAPAVELPPAPTGDMTAPMTAYTPAPARVTASLAPLAVATPRVITKHVYIVEREPSTPLDAKADTMASATAQAQAAAAQLRAKEHAAAAASHVAANSARVAAETARTVATPASEAAGAVAWSTHLATQIARSVGAGVAHDVSKEVAASLKGLPRQVADDDLDGDAHAHRPAHLHWSRDLIQACAACDLRQANLQGVDLHGLSITGDDLRGANLRGANLAHVNLNGVDLRDADLTGANLEGATLSGVELRGANFDNANLHGITLTGVELLGTSLRGTSLRDVVASCVGCDLHGMDLRGQDLHGIVISGVDLRGANLAGARLNGVHFTGVDLSHTNLSNADLTGAILDGCDLSGANLDGARTGGIQLHGTSLGD